MKTQYASLLFLLLVSVFTFINAAPVDDQQEKEALVTTGVQTVDKLADEIKEEELVKSNPDVEMKENVDIKVKHMSRGNINVEEVEEDNNANDIEKGTNNDNKSIQQVEEEVAISRKKDEEVTDAEEDEDDLENGLISEQEDPDTYYRETTSEECKTFNGKMECKVKSCKWFHKDDEPVCTEYKKEVPLLISPFFFF